MSEPVKKNLWDIFKTAVASYSKKQYVSEFVKKSRALTLRANQTRLLWDSAKLGTYIRKKHGSLK